MICCFVVIAICLTYIVLGTLIAIIQGVTEGLRDGIIDVGSQMIDEVFDNHDKKSYNKKK